MQQVPKTMGGISCPVKPYPRSVHGQDGVRPDPVPLLRAGSTDAWHWLPVQMASAQQLAPTLIIRSPELLDTLEACTDGAPEIKTRQVILLGVENTLC